MLIFHSAKVLLNLILPMRKHIVQQRFGSKINYLDWNKLQKKDWNLDKKKEKTKSRCHCAIWSNGWKAFKSLAKILRSSIRDIWKYLLSVDEMLNKYDLSNWGRFSSKICWKTSKKMYTQLYNNFILYCIDMTTTTEAIKHMCKLYEQVTWTPATTETTRWRSGDPKQNPTIAKIATSIGGRQRFIDRHESKIKSKIKETTTVAEMDEMETILKECLDLMKQRNAKYWDSWKVLSIPSIANLCEMKLHRIANMKSIDPKVEDELMDTINYCCFALYSLYRQ